MNVRTRFALCALIVGTVLTVACGSNTPSQGAAGGGAPGAGAAAAPAASPPAAVAPRVFFIEPAAGAIVKSPVKLRFGIEGVQLAAVPAGEVTTARPGMGHHHVGVD